MESALARASVLAARASVICVLSSEISCVPSVVVAPCKRPASARNFSTASSDLASFWRSSSICADSQSRARSVGWAWLSRVHWM